MAKSTKVNQDRYKIVQLHFLDHSEVDGNPGQDGPVDCKVWGPLYHQTDDAYYVLSWCCGGNPVEQNSKTFCILKSAVKSMKVVGFTKEL